MDCRQCGECCRVTEVQLAERDVEHLSKFLRIKESKFVADYTMTGEDGEMSSLKGELAVNDSAKIPTIDFTKFKNQQGDDVGDVLGIFPVVHEVMRDSKEFAVVSLYKFLKGADISTLAGMDQR